MSFIPALAGFIFTIFFFFGICLWSGLTRAQDVGDTALFAGVFCFGAAGLILRVISRLPLYRAGRAFVFGLRGLKGWHLKLYLAACALIAFSVMLLGALDIAIRPPNFRSGIGRRVHPTQFEYANPARVHRNQ